MGWGFLFEKNKISLFERIRACMQLQCTGQAVRAAPPRKLAPCDGHRLSVAALPPQSHRWRLREALCLAKPKGCGAFLTFGPSRRA